VKRVENKSNGKTYPLMPYLVGLFITVIVLVLLSYLVQLRNRDELCTYQIPQSFITESLSICI